MSSPAMQIRSRVPRIAGAAVERARLTVVPRRRVRAARVPFVTLVSLVLLGGIVGLLLFNTSMQQASFTATTLEGRASALTARQQTLESQLDNLDNPQRIATLGRRLGMTYPVSPAFLDLATGTVSGDATPAVAGNTVRLKGAGPVRPAVLSPPPVVETVPAETATPVDPAAPADPAGDPAAADSPADTSPNTGAAAQ